MTIKLDLNPSEEAGLLALARAQGLSLEVYVEQLLRARSALARTASADTGNVAKAQAFLDWARSHEPVGSLTDASLRRDNLVRDTR